MSVVRPGLEISREGPARHVERHRHIEPYAALVLRGGYVEAGDSGRFHASPGDVLLHDGFEAHQDRFGRSGAEILNLPLPASPPFPFGRIADPDAVVKLAEHDARAAADALLNQLEMRDAGRGDWPDLLAKDLRSGRVPSLAGWASGHGILATSLSRGFTLAYGISPQRYRAEQRGARAARALRSSRASLSEIAFASGFADQPHMTRMLRSLYGAPPGRLRYDYENYVQDSADPPG